MRIATYTRISTDEEHQPYSLEAQATRLEAYIASQEDWSLVRRFSDQLSGATLERPGLTRALAEARAGRFDLLLVYRVDRLARSVRGLAQLLEELDAAGVGFRSATEPFDTASPAGRMMVQMLGVFAEFERATIIDRVIAGMERKAARGGWCGGREPFGYRVTKGEGRLEVDESEAPLVEVIFDLYARKRLGAHAVANWLNEAGHRTKGGRRWSFKSVLTVLRNRTYVGEVQFRGTWHPGTHPPLVDRSVFDTAQSVLRERGEDVSKRASNSSDYLLTGLVICDSCKHHFTGTVATGRHGGKFRYYTCASRQRYGSKTCSVDRLPADALDDAVLRSLLDTYERTDLFERAAQAAHRRSEAVVEQARQELALIEAEMTKLEAAIDRYLLAFEAGDLPQATCGERVRGLAARVAELCKRRTDLADLIAAERRYMPTEQELARLRDKVGHAIQTGPASAAKSLIRGLVAEVRVESRRAIRPMFRLPADYSPGDGVRAPSRLVRPQGLEP